MFLHKIVLLALVLLLAGSLQVRADGEDLYIYTFDEEGAGGGLMYSTCGGEDADIAHECQVYDLTCTLIDDVVTGSISIMEGEDLVPKLMAAPEILVGFRMGGSTTTVQFYGFEAMQNQMAGGWIITLEDDGMADAFTAINASPDGALIVDILGTEFDLTPRADDREAFRQAIAHCAKLNEPRAAG